MLHQNTKNYWLEHRPVDILRFGDSYEIVSEKYSDNFIDEKKA